MMMIRTAEWKLNARKMAIAVIGTTLVYFPKRKHEKIQACVLRIQTLQKLHL